MNRTTKVPKGFEISFTERDHILTIRAWGLWDKEFAQKCCRMLAAKIRETSERHANWSMLIDMKELNPQSPECECLAEKQIESAQAQFVQKIGILETPQFTTRWSFTQGLQDTVRIGSEKEIQEWLTHPTHENEKHKEPLNAF